MTNDGRRRPGHGDWPRQRNAGEGHTLHKGLPCVQASKAGAVRRWKHNGAAAVAEEQRGVSWVASNGDDDELSLLWLLHESEGGGRREMRAHEVTGECWG